ncbi:MAG: HAD-superfamily hydrolase, subfamily variant 3 [Candidatus Saccharibacteria bacterium]|nr:HAD-superfamily hydrolase, subfamily variant 3 [Candidatus Saccharibacteria bacterium]
MIKAIIFDCFGVVLVDAFDAAYEKFGGDVAKDHDFIVQTFYESHTGGAFSGDVLAKHLGIDPKEWKETINEGSTLNQNVLDYVGELRTKYKTGMLSNVGGGRLPEMFEPGVLEKYFDAVVGSGDIGYAKPEPEAYEITADLLGVRLDECVFIDDRQHYVDGAKAVGMQGILYTSLSQLKSDLEVLLKK